jgi:hypothetical protein
LIQCSKDDINSNTKVDHEIQTRTTVDPDCLPIPGSACTQKIDTFNISINQFQGCTFKIAARVQKCPLGNNDYIYNIGDFSLLEHNCPTFDQALLNLNGEYLESFIFNFKAQIREAIILHYLNTEQQIEGKRITFSHYYASCMMACIVPVYEKFKPYGLIGYIFYSLNCGDTCCKLEVIHQFVNGSWTLISRRTISPGGICNPAGNACLPGSFKSTNCFAQCSSVPTI